MSAKQATVNKLQGSVGTCLRFDGVVNNQIKNGLLLGLWVKNVKIGKYLAKLQARTWLSCALSSSFSGVLARRAKCTRHLPASLHWRSQDFWLGGPVNFHHWLRLPWTTLVTVKVVNNRHWKYGTHKTERRKREVWSAEGATIEAQRGCGGVWGGVSPSLVGSGLGTGCAPPQKICQISVLK